MSIQDHTQNNHTPKETIFCVAMAVGKGNSHHQSPIMWKKEEQVSKLKRIIVSMVDAEGANISFFVCLIFFFNNDDLAAGGY